MIILSECLDYLLTPFATATIRCGLCIGAYPTSDDTFASKPWTTSQEQVVMMTSNVGGQLILEEVTFTIEDGITGYYLCIGDKLLSVEVIESIVGTSLVVSPAITLVSLT